MYNRQITIEDVNTAELQAVVDAEIKKREQKYPDITISNEEDFDRPSVNENLNFWKNIQRT
jgi:hypothetical protein